MKKITKKISTLAMIALCSFGLTGCIEDISCLTNVELVFEDGSLRPQVSGFTCNYNPF